MPVNRQLGLALAAGLCSALMFLSLAKGVALGAVLSYWAPLPLMMAGLALGMRASTLAAGVAAVAVAAVAGGFSVVPFAVAAVLPALLVTNRALLWRTAQDGSAEWYPPGLVLAWLTAAGLALMLTGTALVAGSSPDGVEGTVAKVIGQALDQLAAGLSAEERKRVAGWWTPLFPAMVIASWLVMSVLNATGTQGLLARMGRARRPSPAYGQLELPDWLGAGLVVAAGTAIVVRGDIGYVATNALVVMLVPFVLLGLTVIHRWAKGRPNAGLVLAATYGLLIVMFGWAAAAVAGLGLVRFWTMRFRRPKSGGGMED